MKYHAALPPLPLVALATLLALLPGPEALALTSAAALPGGAAAAAPKGLMLLGGILLVTAGATFLTVVALGDDMDFVSAIALVITGVSAGVAGAVCLLVGGAWAIIRRARRLRRGERKAKKAHDRSD